MKLRIVGRAVSGTVVLGAAFIGSASIAATEAAAKPVIVTTSQDGKVLSVGVNAPPRRGVGWGGTITIPAPTGQDLFIHYACPHSAPIPLSGAFIANAAAQPGFQLVGDGRRTDIPHEWQWSINWPSGAPAGAEITVNVYCLEKIA